jgi:hypothetical protein
MTVTRFFSAPTAHGEGRDREDGTQHQVRGDATTLETASVEPSHVPSGPALLAIALSEVARGIRGLDLLRRSVDRAPPRFA